MIISKKYFNFEATCEDCKKKFFDSKEAKEHTILTNHIIKEEEKYDILNYIRDLIDFETSKYNSVKILKK